MTPFRHPRNYWPTAMISIAALSLPQPAMAGGPALLMSLCGGASMTIPIPGAPPIPDEKGCCKGCHASSDRRKKKAVAHNNAGDDDDCC